MPRPEPSAATLLADALVERARDAARARRAPPPARSRTRARRRSRRARPPSGGLAAIAQAGLARRAAPRRSTCGSGRTGASPGSTPTWRTFKAIKNALGGTVNDVVLTVVAGALRRHYLAHGHDTEDVELKAMVPVSVRADSERGALGNKVTTMYAPLPIGLDDPIARYRAVHEAMRGLKESGQAVGAEVITSLADFAPPTILAQAARLQAVQRFFNLTVTNVPGPAVPALPARAAAARGSTRWSRWPRTARSGSRSCPTTGGSTSACVADYDALPDLDDARRPGSRRRSPSSPRRRRRRRGGARGAPRARQRA